ncbi:MAG: ATP-binding protein [Halobacteriaceae archaeon]
MSTARRKRDAARWLPHLLVGFGAVLALFVVGEWAVVALIRGKPLGEQYLVGVLTSLPFVLGILYGGIWLSRSGLGVERYPRIAGWLVGGVAIFVAINVLTMVVQPPGNPSSLVGWLRWAASLGGGIGLLTGTIEARAIERERIAEREAVRAEIAESERELLDYVNSLLRHEALNAANVISGNASLLMEGADEETRRRLRVIERQSEDLSQVIDDVRVLLQSAGESPVLEPWPLDDVLETEVAALRERTDAEVAVTGDTDVAVAADNLLPRLFSNLLSNAVEHNDAETPRVTVSVDAGPETVTVRVSDNGPGIDESRLEAIFEREANANSSHHLGLYLVRTLAECYGGSVRVAETGPEGTTMAVELPRPSPAPDRAAAEAA